MRIVEVVQAAAPVVGAAGIVIAAAQRRLIKLLRSAGAVAPDRAVAVPRLAGIVQWRLARLVTAGVVVRLGDDRVYLDETALAARRRRKMTVILTLAVLAALAVIVLRLTQT